MDDAKTTVVNLHHKVEYDVYIGRAGHGQDGYFGNPILIGKKCPICSEIHQRSATIACFKQYFYNRLEIDIEFKNRILELRGKRLGCFCKPKECHGDVIVDYLNNLRAS